MPAPTTGSVSDVGFDGKVYYNTGLRDTEVLVAVPRITEVALDIDKDEIETSFFGALWKLYRGGMKDVNVELSYRKKRAGLADTVFDAFRDAFLNGSALDVWILDGASDVEGAQGLQCYYEITKMSQPRNMGDSVVTKFTCRPTDYEESSVLILPAWYTVPGA